jgi:hypothetical protein
MVPTLQATQAREGIETTREQAERAYYVVTEAERTAFFDLERFRGGRAQQDRRNETFVRSLRDELPDIRFDIARRDFAAVKGSPLAYRRIGAVAHIFREEPSLEPAYGTAKQGLATSEDERWLRWFWEVRTEELGRERRWSPLTKGGDFARFYADIALVILWENEGCALKSYVIEKWGSESKRIYSQDWYFRPGLTWPLRTQRGFNLRVMPAGCVFAHKGPAIFPSHDRDMFFILGVANSTVADYLLRGLISFGSWEVGAIKRLPIPQPTSVQHESIGSLAKTIHDAKAAWDEGNETSTRFSIPWLLRNDLVGLPSSISARLDRLAVVEPTEESHIQELYDALNDEAYELYGMSGGTRATVEEALGNRPPEVLWPQLEGRTAEQKRMEHVYRLLSYAVKRVVEADEDGIIPFASVAGEPSLLERVIAELQVLFPDREAGQIEIEINNELKRGAKGYRRSSSIAEWLENVFFDYHCGLYKSRPIIWHIASAQGTNRFAFGSLVHYHRFDKNRMGKLRGQYLRDAIESFRREAALADRAGRGEERLEWQSRLEEAQDLDRRLQWVQEGRHDGPGGTDRDFRILTPWMSPAERPKGWDPDLDDGVKVNIEPMQKAGVLRIARVV